MTKREKYEAGAATPDGAFYFGCYVEGVTKWDCADCPKKLHKVCQDDYASAEERTAFCRDWLAKHPKPGPSKAELRATIEAKDAEIAKLCNTIEAKNAEIDIRDAEIRILRAQRAAAKPDTRYPWDEAPEWAICAATDSDGWEGWYEVTPKPGEVIFGKGVGKVSVMHRDTPDWRDSLEYRPGYKPEEADK